jgi:hypothetical protein
MQDFYLWWRIWGAFPKALTNPSEERQYDEQKGQSAVEVRFLITRSI